MRAITASPSASSSAPAPTLDPPSPGTQLGGGRYRVDERIGAVSAGTLFRATDLTSNQAVEVVALESQLATDRAISELYDLCERLKASVADSIGLPIEVASEGSIAYLVCQAVPGTPLSAHLSRKKTTGAQGLAPRAAGNLIGRLCTTLGKLHESGIVHGFISPSTIRIDKAGNVNLAALGLAPLAGSAASVHASPGVAPELASTGASSSTDLFALGAVLYETLVGAPPSRGCARPSEVVGVSSHVDQVVAAAMHRSVDRRPPDASSLNRVLKEAIAMAGAAAQAGDNPQTKRTARPSLAESLATDSIAETDSAKPTESQAAAASPEVAGARTSGRLAAVSAALASDDEAWLVTKDSLDHGPFSMAQVFEMIRSDQILPGNILVNKHTGERAPVQDHPLLSELVDEAKAARDESRRADAEVAHSKTEKRRGVAVYGFIGLAVVALGTGAYLLVNKLSGDSNEKSASIGALEEGDVAATISFPTGPESGRRGKRGPRTGKRGNGAKGPSSNGNGNEGGWDDVTDFGDASKSGGDERLDNSQINPVVQRAGGRLGGCLRRNGGGSAAIAFVIKGTGKVSFVKVNGDAKSPLANCVRGVMKSLKFPSFDGSRTRANFNMAI